tara:strand:+ start:1527 stop:1922 length:396 start_codon:yes stop_codon:yes gene_type:complete
VLGGFVTNVKQYYKFHQPKTFKNGFTNKFKIIMRYQNKYFREVLEKDLKERDLGVNIHCKEDGIHITVPPYPIVEDSFTNDYADQLLREDYDTERIVKAVQIVAKEYSVSIDLEKAVYGDNIRIKLKVDDE